MGRKRKQKPIIDDGFALLQKEFNSLWKWYKKEEKKYKESLKAKTVVKNTSSSTKLKFERVIIERQEVL